MTPNPIPIAELVEKTRSTLMKDDKAAQESVPPCRNLASFLRTQAEDSEIGNHNFLISIDESNPQEPQRQSLTFAEFDRKTNRAANLLLADDIGLGRSVGFIGENIPEMHLTYIGIGKVGGLCAPLNPKDSVEKWRLTFKDCRVDLIVVQECFFNEKFFDLVKSLHPLKAIYVICRDSLPSHPELSCPVRSFNETLAQQEEDFSASEDIDWKVPYLLVYTSGTTGTPKGVLIAQDSIWRCADSINRHYGLGPGDTTFAQLSGFHVNHIVVSFWGALAGGYRCFMSNRFIANHYFQHLRDENISVSSVVPTNLAYALKAELESGEITGQKTFQDGFQGFLIENLATFLQAKETKAIFAETLVECNAIIDAVKFQRVFLEKVLAKFQSKEEIVDFSRVFRSAFSFGFAKAFYPFFLGRYGLTPSKVKIICGAGDLALDLAFNFSRMTGLHITQGWGMSEGTCYNSMSPSNQSWFLYWLTLGSIGVEMDTTNMGIVATDSDLNPIQKDNHLIFLTPREMADHLVGMIVMRGFVASLGYFKNDPANVDSYRNGWLLTGDAGNALTLKDSPGFKNFVRDCRQLGFGEILHKYPYIEERYHRVLKKVGETGNSSVILQILFQECPALKSNPLYFIKGRIKDIIISKGQNMPCDEIEAGVLSHPDVFEAVAVPIADVNDGELPGVVCTLHPHSQVSASELLNFCRNREVLPRIQWPVMLAVCEVLPKTPTGKYQRVRAREVFEGELGPKKTKHYQINVLEMSLCDGYDPDRRPQIKA